MHELDRKGAGERLTLMRVEHDYGGFGRSAARAKQTIGESVRRIPLGATGGDLLSEASEILD